MSLEDKIINPMAPAELPGQRSEPFPKAGKKRRKSGGATSAPGKAKRDFDDEVGGDTTAVLTLGPSDDEPRRPQKKMLFESASDGATLSFAGPAIRKEPPRMPVAAPLAAAPVAKAPAAAPVEPSPAPVVIPPAAKAAEPAPTPTVTAPTLPPKAVPEPKPEPTVAAAKKPVFEVAALAEPEPEPNEAPAAPEFALTMESAADESADAAAESVEAPAAPAKSDEHIEESLTLAFDATLAESLPERTTAVEVETEAPAAPAATTWSAPEPVELKSPEAPAAAIETPAPVEPTPAPALVAPTPVPTPTPAPAAHHAAAVAEAPKAEPKPESEAPSRAAAGLSRSEAIARAARMSARATPRPVPTAAETLAAARSAQQQMRSADLPKNPGDIYGYWTRVKNGRRFPSRADFDAEQVAENWPNSMLLTCGGAAGSHVNFSSVLRLGANRRTRPGDELNFTSMITEWILATGGEAARAGAPVQDTEVFPTPDGTHAYKIVALPLSENQTRVDHVLCHLSRS
jgi:hypothetical protein